MRNRSQKTAETLLLEPTKNKEKRLRKVASSKAQRNVRLGSLQATRPNSRKRCLGRACEKAEPQQVVCPSHCETAAGKLPKRCFWNLRKMPKRCFWNLLKTKKKGCLKQGKPLRNVRLGSLQATRPNSRKRCLGRACET